MAKMTKAVQQTAVGEGFALGCIGLGVESFSAERLAVGLSFIHAWREWPETRLFTSVKADLDRNDIFGILRSSENRRGGIYAAWSCERVYTPFLRDWTADEVAAGLELQCGVDTASWEQLARLFLDEMGPDKVTLVRP